MYMVVEKRGNDLKELERAIEDEIKYLMNTTTEEYIKNVTEISRNQSFIDGKWVTSNYELIVAYGGPGICISTDGSLICAKDFNYIEVRIINVKVLKKLKEIESYLETLGE